MRKNILAIDGGGVLGIGAASFMEMIERYTPPIRFEAFAGTSVGSILASAAAIGMPWTKIRPLFEEKVHKIFAKPSLSWRMDLRKPEYDNAGLKQALKEIFGDRLMSDVSSPLFIVAMNYKTGKPKIYDNTDSVYVRDAVLQSCSAPTYFPPVDGIVDGGLVANNPSMCLITGLIQKFDWELKDMRLLSLGTNGDYWKDPKIDANTSKVEWAKILLESPTRGNEEIATFQSRALLGDRMFRVEPILSKDYAMDDLKCMDDYSKIWTYLYALRKSCYLRWMMS